MLCYLGRTFCDRGEACQCGPRRKLTEQHKAHAIKLGLPVALANLCNPTPPKTKKDETDK